MELSGANEGGKAGGSGGAVFVPDFSCVERNVEGKDLCST